MSFNRFRFYDIMQKSFSTVLLATTVAGSIFIGVNVYNNWVEKQKLQKEMSYHRMTAAVAAKAK
ncbi:hypothetical protein LPJ64_001832 [Coemansia asiatica]|uniref:Uncharacterized protein n=1 Tax=Coemansia asiatica TaxID=1052880 RepID=A0A9W7XP78_9FUNG|nr:hypothetical protein LPJ64_001832 [Coemansia asiatica]